MAGRESPPKKMKSMPKTFNVMRSWSKHKDFNLKSPKKALIKAIFLYRWKGTKAKAELKVISMASRKLL